MQVPLAYLDASAIEEVPIDLWREAFDALGWPASLRDKRATFEHKDVQHAIHGDEFNENLLYLLETLHTLGDGAGRDAITSVMAERHVTIPGLPDGVGERELAMQLHLAQRSDPSLADVLARAQTQIREAGDRRRYNEFLAREARALSNLKGHRKDLHAAVLRHCQDSDLGEHVQVQAFEDDGDCVFTILRSDRMKKPLAIQPGQSARAQIRFRPVHGDILRYEVSLGRLRIAARSPSMVEFYRAAFGSVVFGDEDFFRGDPVCSLSVLQERGRAALDDHGVFGVSRVRLTECVWECGDRSLIVLRDQDCFGLIERHDLSLTEGTFVQAKLKVDVIGKSTRPVTVSVRVPSRIEVSQKIHESLIDELLDAIGIRTPADPARQFDICSLHPWRQPLAVWRAVFGETTDVLVQHGVLRSVALQAVWHPDHSTAGRVLHVERIAEWDHHGVSEAPEIPSRALSSTDIEGLELAPEQFRKYIRKELGITAGGVVWGVDDELLELGWLRVGDERLYLAYAIRQPRRDLGARLRGRADGAPVVLLLPATQPEPPGFPTVRLSSPIPALRQVIRDGVAACGIAERMPALMRAPERARLVVDTQRKRVWVDGIEVEQLSPDTHPYQFVEMMAKSNGACVSVEEITQALSAARFRSDGTTAARQAKRQAKNSIAKALEAAGTPDSSDPFPSAGTGLYRCKLPSFVE